MRARLEEIRREASDRVRELEARLDVLKRDRRGESDDDEHDPEGVTLSSEWSHLQGVLDGARAELKSIDDALEREARGTYGVCVDCGNEIPPGRLEARPFAVRCVPCAERQGA